MIGNTQPYIIIETLSGPIYAIASNDITTMKLPTICAQKGSIFHQNDGELFRQVYRALSQRQNMEIDAIKIWLMKRAKGVFLRCFSPDRLYVP